jgi:hypothetical protein
MYDQSVIDIFKDCFGGTQLKLFDEDDCMIPQYDIKDLDKIDGHEYVDLGLTSGLKWAACNIGANSPDDAGNYYAWGEIEPKKDYFEEESITNGKKMRDISADPEYDAARAVWGGSWRMPTKKEIAELMKECKFYLVRKDNVVKYIVIGPNGNYITLPISGFRIYEYDSFEYLGLLAAAYWSSTPNDKSDDMQAYAMTFLVDEEETVAHPSPECRFYGFNIRAVSE